MINKNAKEVRIIRKFKIPVMLLAMILCLSLYELVNSRRSENSEVILGGADNAFVDPNFVEFKDPNYVEVVLTESDTWDWPEISADDFDSMPQYKMVNDSNLLSSAYTPENEVDDSGKNYELETISGTSSMQFSTLAIDQLNAMLQDMRDAGFTVYVAGAYRSYSYQEILFNGKASQIAYAMGVTDYMDPLYQDAAEEARTITMYPGASEHQLGLAVDLMDKSYSRMVYENMNQDFFEYLDSICAKYGFIKRYPTKKLLLTGWDEPWHYRYVGVEAATFIMEHGICYEEFYAHYVSDFTY